MHKLRVLLVADSISPSSSGGLAVNRLIDVLLTAGARVAVFSINGSENTSTRRDVHVAYGAFSGLSHLFHGKQTKAFEKFVDEVSPDVVHWSSLDYLKSRYLIEIAKSAKARLVAQPWVYNFFCAQGYNYKDGRTCNKCLPDNFQNAIRYRCGDTKSKLIQTASLALYRSNILDIERFLSTGSVMDDILVDYGIDRAKIKRCPLPFDPKRLAYLRPHINETKESFVFFGQFKDFKGALQLKQIVNEASNVMFDIHTLFAEGEDKVLTEQRFWEHNNVSLQYKSSWASGLDVRVANSLGIILPSLWPTSTEYVLLEAMALRKPVVAYNVGVHKDMLQHRENAMVIEPGNVTDFADAVQELHQNFELRQQLGANALETITQVYSDDNILSPLRDAYLN